MAKITNIKPATAMIYIGPSLPGGALPRFSIYKNGVPDTVTAHPAIKALFIPVTDLATKVRAIAQKGSLENVLYNDVLQFIKEGGK